MALLSCKNLCVGYGGYEVTHDISCEVGVGDFVCVIGENGAGKSTFLKTLLGLLPPLHGNLLFDEGLEKTELGYLPQRDESQRDFPASVGEIVLSGCLSRIGARPFYSRAEHDRVKWALAKVGMEKLGNRPFGALSGGQQQRVLLARALCAASRLLVLDEPTTGLDPKAAADLYETIDALRADGMGAIAVVHDVDTALRHASHILRFEDGTAHFFTADEALAGGDAR